MLLPAIQKQSGLLKIMIPSWKTAKDKEIWLLHITSNFEDILEKYATSGQKFQPNAQLLRY